MRSRWLGGPLLALVALVALSTPAAAVPEGPQQGTPAWYAREAQNVAKTSGEQRREMSDPAFAVRLRAQSDANLQSFLQRQHDDPDWNTTGNVCATWQDDCAGDPFLYPGVDPFYTTVGRVQPISYYDDGGARISGRVWAPRSAGPDSRLPGVVIETGSVQAPETLYWWFAQTLVRNGYVVMTYDVRGQGRSDNHTPDGAQGGNANPSVFWNGLVDAVDWFRSTPTQTYTYNKTWVPRHPQASANHPNNDVNPFWQLIDHNRLGIVGHSLGAVGVSVVQGLEPWPGIIGHGGPNPVDATVAWDNLATPTSNLAGVSVPHFSLRTPALGSSNDYSLVVQPYTSEPDPEGKKVAFHAWEQAHVPTMQVVIQGGTHYEYSRLAQFPVPFPTTSWTEWGNPFANHYSLAWLDRWLKASGETGYADADARLLADASWAPRMSFYLRSARDFPDRAGSSHICQDIRAGCSDSPTPFLNAAASTASPPPTSAPQVALPNTSADPPRLAIPALALAAIAGLGAIRRGRRRGRTPGG